MEDNREGNKDEMETEERKSENNDKVNMNDNEDKSRKELSNVRGEEDSSGRRGEVERKEEQKSDGHIDKDKFEKKENLGESKEHHKNHSQEMKKENNVKLQEKYHDGRNWYDRSYKLIIIIPLIVLILSVGYLWYFNNQHGDIILKDVSLTGGTSVTVFDKDVDIDALKNDLKEQFDDLIVRGISDLRTGGQQGFLLETKAGVEEVTLAIEVYLGYELTQDNSSIEFSGASLSTGFYHQLRLAILIAFVFMAIVVFIIFRTLVPSFAVILSAFADIVMTIAVVNLLGISLSSAGIVAILMLIGYSVDTDILLTSRVLKKKEGNLNSRMFSSFKTGLTMTLTSIAAIGVALFVVYGVSDILRQMFTIILIGLGFDIFNTWLGNAGILKWYAERKGIE
jgi:preprotein translocase subunit SecF